MKKVAPLGGVAERPPSPPSFAVNCNKEVDAGVGAFCLSFSSFAHHYTAE